MRKICLTVFTALMCVLFCGCGEEKQPQLVMATNATFPPYEYRENGKIVGVDPEIIQEIAGRLGYRLKIEDMSFDSIIAAVQTGKADIAASGITVTEDRKQKVLFSHPYVMTRQVIIVRKDSAIADRKDLFGKNIGVQHGTSGDLYVAKNYSEPMRFAEGTLAIEGLITKRLDAVVLDGEPAAIHVARRSELKILPEPLLHEEYAFAVSKSNTALLAQINEILLDMQKSGRLNEIRKKYEDLQDQVAAENEKRETGFWAGIRNAFEMNFIKDNRYKYLLNGFLVTMEIAFFAVLLGIVIGFTVAVIRSTADQTGKLKFLDWLCRIYLTVIRGTPVVVQLLVIYFVIFGSVDISKVLVAIIAFGINSGAYVAEIIRGGIMSIEKGQLEAGRSLGLSYGQTMQSVILPQAVKSVLPALGNEFIVLLKETSVSGYIALQDLTKGGDIIRSQTYEAFMPLIAVALIYLAVVMLFSALLRRLEMRLKRNE